MVPVSEIGDGLHIGIPEHASPFGRIRFSAQTVSALDGARFTVLVGEGSQVVTSAVKTVVIALAIAAPIVVAVSAAATYMLVARSMRSVDAIRSRVADISTSDLAERVPVPESRDEIAALAETMNEMLARIEAGHTAQQRFVGDASHELRSPLATIISALEVAVAHPELLDKELAAGTLIPEAHRMQALVDDLLLLARADERGLGIRREDVDLDDLAADEAQKLRRETSLAIHTELTPTRRSGTQGHSRGCCATCSKTPPCTRRHVSTSRWHPVAAMPRSASPTTVLASPQRIGSVYSIVSSGWIRTAHAAEAAPDSGWPSCARSLRRIVAA
jgi:signal transduction histidine kinase